MWIKCKPYTGCSESPTFDPSSSQTYGKIAYKSSVCPASSQFSYKANGDYGYMFDYGDTSNTRVVLIFDAFNIYSQWFLMGLERGTRNCNASFRYP